MLKQVLAMEMPVPFKPQVKNVMDVSNFAVHFAYIYVHHINIHIYLKISIHTFIYIYMYIYTYI
jgi:hypothetical protein